MNVKANSVAFARFSELKKAKKLAFLNDASDFARIGVKLGIPLGWCIGLPSCWLASDSDSTAWVWIALIGPVAGLALWIFFDWLVHQWDLRLTENAWRNRVCLSLNAPSLHFALYLRDHEGDHVPGYIHPMVAATNPYDPVGGYKDNTEGFKKSRSKLKKLIQRRLPVYTLWRHGTSIGFNPVFAADEEWKTDIEFMMEHANVIFVDV